MWRGGMFGLLAAMTLSAGDDIGLVRVTDEWRWFRGSGVPAEPPAGWWALEFDDSAWPVGPAGFTFTPGHYEATTFYESGATVAPVYLRRSFEVADPAAITWLILRVDWSGGFVAFLNGQEVVRRNLPGDPGVPAPFDLVPPLHNRAGREEIDLTDAVSFLRPGRNVMAIQWHENSSGRYGSGLIPELLANCTRGPALAAGAPDRQTILWRAPLVSDGWVEYGATPDLGATSAISAATTNHVVTLTGLEPDHEYYYRVVSRTDDATARSPVSRFRSLKATGPIEFMVAADVGTGWTGQYNVARVLREKAPDLVLMAGDLVYPGFTEAAADFRWYSVYGEQLRTTPIFVVAGNHDVLYKADHTMVNQFSMPTNGPVIPEYPVTGGGTKGHYFYSFDHGNAHFVGLYVPLQHALVALTPDSEQVRWLAKDLAASDRPWKFLFLHHPIMSSGPHGWDDYNANSRRDTLEVAEVILPLAVAYGVQVVFSGHDHIYERFTPVQGVQAVVTGGGGGSLYPTYSREAASVQKWSRTHCLHVRVDGAELTLRALDQLGQEFDRFYLRREPLPPDTVLMAARGTPDAGTDLPPDGDGNRRGQRFAFAGTPVTGVAGTFANPGRLWVNVDAEFLYLGVEQMVLPDGDDLLLFLELPSQPGVTTLAGLGNGLPPPDAEGANALDLLENLAFAPGFTPSVACVLGDEFADAPDRQFVRAEVVEFRLPAAENARIFRPAAMGQGAFWLRAELPDVPGCRLEQFNRSPQLEPEMSEQAANFAIVSLPLDELGLTGGERLRVGAVVARRDPPADVAGQRRWLDRAFLGQSFVGGGFEPSVLAGIEVQLPAAGPRLALRARLLAGGDLELTWDALPGRRYRLEVAPALDVPFVEAAVPGQPRTAVGPEESWVIPADAPLAAARFYRLALLP